MEVESLKNSDSRRTKFENYSLNYMRLLYGETALIKIIE